jgi:hypothetical protein
VFQNDDGPIGGHRPEYHEGHDQALMGITGMVTNTEDSK